ncbi:hypothetical protein C8F04DRAFT_369758 [Mycena alexandri]|uniref:Uncharacterized protein n=1 Tax=Mycena alexandri TaxID=1745969 RepID=A0AAD6XAH7_9AGAR|nr:hypothetical protein C8F04DRAFT_369758 [Mycena alexandri]
MSDVEKPFTMIVPSLHHIRQVRQPDQVNCFDAVAPSGDGIDTNSEDGSSTNPEDVEHDIGPVDSPLGIHRFIGVMAVAIVILLVFLLWLGIGAWPRRKLRAFYRSRSTSVAPAKSEAEQSNDGNGVEIAPEKSRDKSDDATLESRSEVICR